MFMEVQLALSSFGAFFEKVVENTALFCHVELADLGVMIDEDASLGLSIGDCLAIMGHGFIGRVVIWGVAEASNELSHIWALTI